MNHSELAERLGALHAAASDGRWSEVEQGMHELDQAKTLAFAQCIRKMAVNLQEDMRSLQLDSRLARAAAEIPDACSRLDAVIQLTEDAATQTLDLVEDSRTHVLELQSLAQDKRDWSLVSEHAAALRKNMTDLSTAQAYQDLSGQIIRKVMGIVGNLETTLGELMELAGIEPAQLEEPDEGELLGPAAGRTDAGAAASQADADDLLSNLGI